MRWFEISNLWFYMVIRKTYFSRAMSIMSIRTIIIGIIDVIYTKIDVIFPCTINVNIFVGDVTIILPNFLVELS